MIRQRLIITGVVQGVGFRPFVYRLAHEYGVNGFVGNNSGGVFIEVEGSESAVQAFQTALFDHPPPLAHIETISAEPLHPCGENGFIIVHSETQARQNTLISPDICVCDACLQEVFDPTNRRYQYPFTNCTHCGPRFTIVRDIPYDRPLTTMAAFPMCPDCQREYDDPLDRRFHAQPNACPVCGPFVFLVGVEGGFNGGIGYTQKLLLNDKIIAIKGLGGFHLACNATSNAALQTLRERKGRVDKPFAVMSPTLEMVRQFAYISPEEAALLTSRERPILLLRKKHPFPLSSLISPGNDTVGVMLPYTPLHYLLFSTDEQNNTSFLALVMTSGNYSDEPIVKDNDEALERLSGLADAFLLHNRDIHTRCDDSVVRVLPHASTLLPFRRSRGYAPFPVKLPIRLPPTLGVGGELKATFCLAKDEYGYMSQHIGDMENLETLQAFEVAVAHFETIFRTQPELLACDLHPGYLSTQWALENPSGVPVVQIQHHHAHIASVMAEHRLSGDEPVIGFSFDGTGYGTDGAIWGGEVLVANYREFERANRLKYVPLAGGDISIKRPYRMALSYLWDAGEAWDETLPCVIACPPAEQRVLRHQLETGWNTVPTSSMGRLFDAVAALTGIRQKITYEGQAAIEMEALATQEDAFQESGGRYAFDMDGAQFDAAPVIRAVAADVRAGVAPSIIAAKFHRAVASLIVDASLRLRKQTGLNRVALSGGVFQNVALLSLSAAQLQANGFETLLHHIVPPNDGGLALGQVMVGRMKAEGYLETKDVFRNTR